MKVDFEKTEHQALVKFPDGEYRLVDIYQLDDWYYFRSGKNFINLRSNHCTSKSKCDWLKLYLEEGWEFKEGVNFKIVKL